MVEIANHGAQGDELRAVAKTEIATAALSTGALKRGHDRAPGRTRHDSAGQNDKMERFLRREGAAHGFASQENVLKRESTALVARRCHDDKGGVCLLHGFADILRRV